MSAKTLRTTTAILAAFSLLQPLPAMTQSASENGPSETEALQGWEKLIGDVPLRSFEELCADAKILEAEACEAHVLALQAEAAAEAKDDDGVDSAAESDMQAEEEVEAEAAPEQQADEAAAQVADSEAEAAQAQAAEDAASEAAAEAEAQAAVATEAEAAEESAAAAEEAQAAADAEAQAADDAAAAAEAQDANAAKAQTAEDTASEAAAETETQAEADAASATAIEAEACLATTVASDGTIVCVDELSDGSIAAIAGETGDTSQAEVEVTTETVTEGDVRSSSEEFRDLLEGVADGDERADTKDSAAVAAKSDSGLSDLEKAGLLALGAVVVGAILTNGQRVEANTGDRVVVVDDDGTYRVLKDDDALLRQPGSEVRTERFGDGSTRTTVTHDDGTRIVTIRDATGRALRRLRIEPDGREYLLIDDTLTYEPVIVVELPTPDYDEYDFRAASDRESLRKALLAAERRDLGRSFSLRQVRDYVQVRELVPEINFENITFATNSAALDPSQAEQLREMGLLMRDLVADNPSELFLIEGHTDAIGAAGYNLLLSDRRAESVALALNEYFRVPAENMVVQGYGESYLRVPTQEAERANRRVAVRRITPLLERY